MGENYEAQKDDEDDMEEEEEEEEEDEEEEESTEYTHVHTCIGKDCIDCIIDERVRLIRERQAKLQEWSASEKDEDDMEENIKWSIEDINLNREMDEVLKLMSEHGLQAQNINSILYID